MSARTILKHVYENGGMTEYQYERIDRVLKERERPHGEWIPCSERLPEIRFDLNSRTSDTVFVCLENRTMHMAFYCDDDVWRFCESGEAKEPMWNKVIAWMPLPERYGEEASGMNNPCENCIHKDEVCLHLEFPCLEYQPKEEKAGDEK